MLWVIHALINTLLIIMKKKNWWLFIFRAVAWCMFWGYLYWVHQQHVQSIRETANLVVQQIEQYYVLHGEYPPKSQVKLPKRIRYGKLPNHHAILAYSDNVLPFDDHIYDFKDKTWHYRPD